MFLFYCYIDCNNKLIRLDINNRRDYIEEVVNSIVLCGCLLKSHLFFGLLFLQSGIPDLLSNAIFNYIGKFYVMKLIHSLAQ